jgi:hypothetical protein
MRTEVLAGVPVPVAEADIAAVGSESTFSI